MGRHRRALVQCGLPGCWVAADFAGFISQTVPGRRLFNYAGPAFWILGALVWFPHAIAAYKGVPGAMLTTRSGLAVQMGAVLIGIANTVGNFVSGQVFFVTDRRSNLLDNLGLLNPFESIGIE
ncbi:hypothetical protein L202_00994 [Cryptococcus amylolentus CBS 6039]|uniref:Uncharacterized protein n=1 Tax=Cryptococcus amylolentus CBS 6039 TaxID=1295533 RepID=A0A1E3I290_9TREE|nr:hypothetical protein L202_00994 [Cryptococcus amylolentus CBS 6039]ODN82702.1 hypothetical protein L202_00994 [Cryptococcus amylolentus CBS 6039]